MTQSLNIAFPFIKKLVSEPLLHFLVLSLAIYLLVDDAPEPRQILVEPTLIEQFELDYHAMYGQQPNEEELGKYIKAWISEEALYLEGVEMGIEDQDPVIRQTIINKMYNLLQNSKIISEPTNEEINDFYHENSHQYAVPENFAFQIVLLDSQSTEAQIETRLNELNISSFDSSFDEPLVRDREFIEEYYSKSLADELKERGIQGNNDWFYFHDSRKKYLVKSVGYREQAIPEFEDILDRMIADWKRFQQMKNIDAQIEKIVSKYEVIELEVN